MRDYILNFRKLLRDRKTDIYSLLVLIILVLLIFSPVFYKHRDQYDLGWIASDAKRMASGGRVGTPHVLYQALVILVHTLFPFIGYFSGGVIIIMVSLIAAGLILYFYLHPKVGKLQSPTSSFKTIVLILILLIVALW